MHPISKFKFDRAIGNNLWHYVDRGEIDLLCGLFPERIAWHEEQLLFQERFVCVCRRDRPGIGETISLAEYVNAAHLLVSIQEDLVGRVDSLLAQQNLTRHIALSIPHFLVAPAILARTNLIATLAERVANEFATTQNLKILPCPLPLQGFSVFARWHQSTRDLATHAWLRGIVTEVATNIRSNLRSESNPVRLSRVKSPLVMQSPPTQTNLRKEALVN